MMKSPSAKTIKQLFAVSGNICTFPGCREAIIDQTTGAVIGRVCHIKAKNSDGPRYDPNQSDEDRNSYENLILMCPTHHAVIDDKANGCLYPVEVLHQFKTDHEGKQRSRGEISEKTALEILEISSINIEGSIFNVQTQSVGQISHTIMNTMNPSPTILYKRCKFKKLVIGSRELLITHLKSLCEKFFPVSLLLIFISCLFLKDTYYGLISLGLLVIVSMFYLKANTLLRNKFLRLGFLNIEINNENEIGFIKILGKCPICDGEVGLENLPKGSDLKTMGFCSRNRELHTFSFDYTTFTGVYYPIVWRKRAT